jgi:hypothetical protein
MSYKEKQIQIFSNLLNNNTLTGSAKNQINIFIQLLRDVENIGFDTTSALFFGFLSNPDFTSTENSPLTQEQIGQAKKYFLHKATEEERAKDDKLLKRISSLSLSGLLCNDSNKLDLKDLALSFLTYATTEEHYLFDSARVQPLYEYLSIPKNYYLNVYDLFYDFDKLNIKYNDFIINLSRLKSQLYIPSLIKNISIYYNSFYTKVISNLPDNLHNLTGADLEDFIMETYHKAGYKVVRIGQNTNIPDGGLDIIAYTERAFEGELRFAIQCKAWSNKVDVNIIRSFNTSLNQLNANQGIIIAKSGFTSPAINEVNEYNYRIELMDYIKLTNHLRNIVIKN